MRKPVSFISEEEKAILERLIGREVTVKKRKKKKNTKALRDPVNYEELKKILSFIEEHKKFLLETKIKLKISFIIMFVTGIRVSNVLLLTINDVQNLALFGTAIWPSLKNSQTQRLTISPTQQEWLRSCIELRQTLKTKNKFMIASRVKSNAAIHSKTWIQTMNSVLKECFYNQYVRSHSMRVGFIMKMMDVFKGDLHKVQQLMGHTCPNVTAKYLRYRLTVDEIKSAQDLATKDLQINI